MGRPRLELRPERIGIDVLGPQLDRPGLVAGGAQIGHRLEQLGHGAPRLKVDDGRYLPELVYPQAFSDQPKFNLELAQG